MYFGVIPAATRKLQDMPVVMYCWALLNAGAFTGHTTTRGSLSLSYTQAIDATLQGAVATLCEVCCQS